MYCTCQVYRHTSQYCPMWLTYSSQSVSPPQEECRGRPVSNSAPAGGLGVGAARSRLRRPGDRDSSSGSKNDTVTATPNVVRTNFSAICHPCKVRWLPLLLWRTERTCGRVDEALRLECAVSALRRRPSGLRLTEELQELPLSELGKGRVGTLGSARRIAGDAVLALGAGPQLEHQSKFILPVDGHAARGDTPSRCCCLPRSCGVPSGHAPYGGVDGAPGHAGRPGATPRPARSGGRPAGVRTTPR